MEVTFKVREDFAYVLLKLIQENSRLAHYDTLKDASVAGSAWQEFTLVYSNDMGFQELAAFLGGLFAIGLITKGEIVSV